MFQSKKKKRKETTDFLPYPRNKFAFVTLSEMTGDLDSLLIPDNELRRCGQRQFYLLKAVCFLM